MTDDKDIPVSDKRWQPWQTIVVFVLLSFGNMSTASCTNSKGSTTIQVMAVVPTTFGQDDVMWKRGEEILPGAQVAAREINEFSNLLKSYQLEVIPLRVSQCDISRGIVPFVDKITSKQNNVVGIVGYLCDNVAQQFSRLIEHKPIDTLQISATRLDKDTFPHLQHSIVPLSESIARAAAQLLQRLNWSKVAVMSNQNLNFKDTKDAFLKVANKYGIKVTLSLTLESSQSSFGSSKQYLQELLKFGIKIIVAFVSPTEAVEILCSAYPSGFRWPNYAWILAEAIDIEFLKYSKSCSLNAALTALNNTLVLRLQMGPPNDTIILPSGLNYSTYFDAYLEELGKSSTHLSVPLKNNPYANVLYDSIWAIALAINKSLNEENLSLAGINKESREAIKDALASQLSTLSFQGATGFLNFSHRSAAVQTSVELLQFQNGHMINVGLYNYAFNQLVLNEELLWEIPNDSLDSIYVVYSIPLAVTLTTLIVLCFAVTTVSMFIFFYYRKQPAIKATSPTLSIFMFIGCYFLLTSSLFHTLTSVTTTLGRRNKSYRAFICMFDICLITIGLDLIFATVIAKTLRIYHIFKTFGKVSRICSDQCLAVLISIIISIRVVLLIVWSLLDPSRIVDIEQYVSQSVPPYYLVKEHCEAHYLVMWLSLHFGYTVILMFIMVLLAVLTRNIKREEFKDSKKINMLVAALFFNLSIGVPLWLLLRVLGEAVSSHVVHSVSTMTAAVLCLVFLVLSKIVPLMLQSCRCLDAYRSRAHDSYSAILSK